MSFQIPKVLSLDECVRLEHAMMYGDPEHRHFTQIRFGHEPTDEELARHWFESGASARLHQLFSAHWHQSAAKAA